MRCSQIPLDALVHKLLTWKPGSTAICPSPPCAVQRSSGKGWGLPLRYPSLDGSPLPSARGSGSLPSSARIRASQGALRGLVWVPACAA